MAISTLSAFKAAGESRLLDEKLSADRRRDCLILILHHLQKCGYSQTAALLRIETGHTIVGQYDHADNIDLPHILADYEEYYSLKYGEKPRFSRKCSIDPRVSFRGKYSTDKDALDSRDCNAVATWSRETTQRTGNMRLLVKRRNKVTFKKPIDPCGITGTKQSVEDNRNDTTENSCFQEGSKVREPSFMLSTCSMESLHIGGSTIPPQDENHFPETFRAIKSFPSFGGDVELKALATTIQREILDQSPGVSWDDIVELDDAKKILNEAIILPLKYPQLFRGLLEPWRGVLLYGPPGTGTNKYWLYMLETKMVYFFRH